MPRRSLWIIFAVIVVSLVCYERADRNPYARYFGEVLSYIDRSYVEPVDERKLFEGAVQGMIGQLDDEYTAYLGPRDARHFQEALDQKFGGIGIEVSLDPKTKELVVLSPLSGSPAYKAGVRAGDRIVGVAGRSTKGFTLSDAVKFLRGPVGTTVRVQVLHHGAEEPVEYEIARDQIRVDSVFGFSRKSDGTWNYFVPGPQRLAYIRVDSFGDRTVEELRAALHSVHEQNAKGLILDLRNNPGGFLEGAKETCDLFVPNNALIVTTRGRGGELRDEFRASGDEKYLTIPMAVLVNRYTASAAEIVAACLEDNDRAVVVGERSWGKGTVQNVIPVEGGKSVLKLTTATYWRPSGKNIHRLKSSQATDEWGVMPSPGLEVKLSDADFGKWLESKRLQDMPPRPGSPTRAYDPQLDRALKHFEQKVRPTAQPQQAART